MTKKRKYLGCQSLKDKFAFERRFYFKCQFCGATNLVVWREHDAVERDTWAGEGKVELSTLDLVVSTFECRQCFSLWYEPKPRRLPLSYITPSIPNSLDPYERAEQMQALAEAKQRRIQAGCEKWKRESLLHKWGFNRQEAKGEHDDLEA